MEQINFRGWRLIATAVDAGVLRLEIDALDGSDVVEAGEPGAEHEHEGEQYTLHLSTEKIEKTQAATRSQDRTATGQESDDDEPGNTWPADEDETLYLRGWEVNALVDEEGLLSVTVERSLSAEIYEVEPLDIAGSQSSRIIVRLAAEESEEEEDEGEADDQDADDDAEGYDHLDEIGDDYRDGGEDDLNDRDQYDDGEQLY